MLEPTKSEPVARGEWQKTPLWMRVLSPGTLAYRRRIWMWRNGRVPRRAWEYDDCTIMAQEILQKRFDPDVSQQQDTANSGAGIAGHWVGSINRPPRPVR